MANDAARIETVWTISDTFEKKNVATLSLECDAIKIATDLNAEESVPRFQVERSIRIDGKVV